MGIGPKKFLGFSLLLAGLASSGVGLWLLLSPADYQATVRIETNLVLTDILANWRGMSYDIENEFELIQSPAVLGKVATSLNLNVVWGKTYADGRTLATNEVIAILKDHLRLETDRNTKLIEISFVNENPNVAAEIANAIAKAYQDYRLDMRRQRTLEDIEIRQLQYQDVEKKIQIQQTNVEALLEVQKLLQAKIAAEKIDLQLPKAQVIVIVNAAEQPKSPIGPNRFLGAVLLAIGLLSTVGGFVMLKSSRQPV